MEQVRAEVRARIWEMGRGGGFLLSSSHRLEHDVPTENVLAMIDEAHEYGVYPLPETPPPGADTGADYEPWSEKKARRRRNEDTVAE
jgi:uroporphyrinogen decarboxylase